MTTSFSFVSYTGNGTTQTFNVPFQYISKTHVEVYVDGVLRTTGISWDNDSTIRLDPAPPSGSILRLERNTPKTTALVDFQDAGVLTETALDLNTRQGLFIVQEAFDEASNVVSQAVAAAVAATQVAGRSVPTVPPSAIGRFLVGRASDSYGWANNLSFNEATGVLTATSFVGNVTGNVTGNVSGTAANVTGTVAIANGGTGATSQSAARTALGLGSAATLNATTTGSALVQATDQAAARGAIGLGSAAILNATATGSALVQAANAEAARTAADVVWEQIGATVTVTASQASVDFSLPSGFGTFQLIIERILPTSDSSELHVRLSTDNGTTFVSGANTYAWGGTFPAGGPSYGGFWTTSDDRLVIWSQASNAAGSSISGVLNLFSPRNSGQRTNATFLGHGDRIGAGFGMQSYGGSRLALEDNNALRLAFTTGNIASGRFRLLGLRA